MKPRTFSSPTANAPAKLAWDYQRGWDIAQKEYMRQEKQARLKPTARNHIKPIQSRINQGYQMSG